MTPHLLIKIFLVFALAGCLWGCGKVLPYVNPDGMPTVTVTFQNLAHFTDNARKRFLTVYMFKDDFRCRGISEIDTRTPEVTIQAELKNHCTLFYRASTYVENDPATYTDRCSGMYTFPLAPDNEYRVQFDEKAGRCYLRVLRRSVTAGSEWKGVDELFPRRMTVPPSVNGSWCEEDERFKVPVPGG
jgi:hypothetical protein